MTVCNMSIECGALRRHDRPRREDLRIPPGPRTRSAGSRLRRGCGPLAGTLQRSRRGFRQGVPLRRRGHRPDDHLRNQSRNGDGRRRDDSRRRRSQGVGVHGFQTRGADVGQSGRLRVRRQLHQRPHRGPAPFRPSGRRPPQGGQHHRMDRSRLEGRRGRRAGRGTGPHPRRSGFRTPPAGLFGVPGDERRQDSGG